MKSAMCPAQRGSTSAKTKGAKMTPKISYKEKKSTRKVLLL
jgi:hypothetical protein